MHTRQHGLGQGKTLGHLFRWAFKRVPGRLVTVCGRYATSRRPEDLVEDYRIDSLTGDGPGAQAQPDGADYQADYNVAPTKQAPVVLERRPRGGTQAAIVEVAESDVLDAVDETGEVTADAALAQASEPVAEAHPLRWLRLLTWGLVPSWAKDRSVGYRMINARAETLLDKTFRAPALSRRCLVPADGWYEWQVSATERNAKGKPLKQPFFTTRADGAPLAMAGIYEFWRNPQAHPDSTDAWLTTYAVITVAAEPGLSAIHDRMPLILDQDCWDDWLDPDLRDEDSVRAMLVPPAPGRFTAWPVTTRVNAVANNGPELLDEAPAQTLRGVTDPTTGELIGGSDALF